MLIVYFIRRIFGRSAIKAWTGKAIYFSKRRGEAYLGWLVFQSAYCQSYPLT